VLPQALAQELERARGLDAADPLAPFRGRFYYPPGRLYFDGNSLGLFPKDSERTLLKALEEWKTLAAAAWLDGDPPWVHYGEELGSRVAAFVGARGDEVVVTGSTTMNLHHLVATFFRPEAGRRVIVADTLNFPSDLHALRGQVLLHRLDPHDSLRLVPSRDGWTIDEADVEAALGPDVALVVLSAVLFRSSQWLDMRRLTRAVHAQGALMLWDLSHAIGAVPLFLDDLDADAAFWCHYKYLHAGPGAVGGLYVNRKHHARIPALPGWWGQTLDRMFAMSVEHEPAPGAARWQTGTIPILSAAPLRGALDVIEEAGLSRMREKSVGLTTFLIECVDALFPEPTPRARVISPRASGRRGGHVAIECPGHAAALESDLKDRGVVIDVRPPDLLRLTPAPLTTSYEDVWRAVSILREAIEARA
jgi:kynureninase